ncbi:unnamed protein product, partial [marine sediment metagenome]
MARLIELNGEYFKEADSGWQPLTQMEWTRETMLQDAANQQGFTEDARQGGAKAVSDLWSGTKQLMGIEGPQEAQQFRSDLQQAYQPTEEYGGTGAPFGEFGGSAMTGFLPGGLVPQLGYGALQGAAESPESPGMGAAFGGAITYGGDVAGNMVNRIARTLKGKRMQLDA